MSVLAFFTRRVNGHRHAVYATAAQVLGEVLTEGNTTEGNVIGGGVSSGITPDPDDVVIVAPTGKTSYLFGGIGDTDGSGGAADVIGGDGTGSGGGGVAQLAGGNAGAGAGTGAYIVAEGGAGSDTHGALEVWTVGSAGPGPLVSDGSTVSYSQAAHVDPSTGTPEQIINALVSAGLMAPAP
jgi:hypothetical protein